MNKDSIKTWALSFVLFTVAVMYYMALTNNISAEIPANFVMSAVIAFVPSIIFALSIHYSIKYMHAHEPGKAVWKIPIIILIVFAVLLVLMTIISAFTCYGESCMGVLFMVIYGPFAIIAYVFVFSLLPSLVIRYSNRQKRRCCLYLSMALIVLFFLLIIITYFTCNFGYDAKCLGYKAHKSGDYDICDSAANSITRDRCYWLIAHQTLDVSICHNVAMQDECIQDIENRISLSERGPMPVGI